MDRSRRRTLGAVLLVAPLLVGGQSACPDSAGSGDAGRLGSEGPRDGAPGRDGAVDAGQRGFPVHAGNVFSIQYRNSTSGRVTVWFIGTKPPCSKAEAAKCLVAGADGTWSAQWDQLNADGVFTRSGTRFFIVRPGGTSDPIAVSTHIDLEKGETLRIVLPIVDGAPQWYWSSDGVNPTTSGTTTWVTPAGVTMPAPEYVLHYEFNISVPLDKLIWFNLSAVNGTNGNATMTYEGAGCGAAGCGCDKALPKLCKTNLAAYDGTNDGCPYAIKYLGASVCPNPKMYPATLDAATRKPPWVVPPAQFTTDDVSSKYPDLWKAAGSPSGATMASAPSGDPDPKKAYHVWWSTNPVGQGWLNYLQKNARGSCDAYGWAYDEKRWRPGDSFDVHGDPPDNKDIGALVKCPNTSNTYLNIDILALM
jgi:hypothetical protein